MEEKALKGLRDAILDGYDRAAFEEMLRFGLGLELEEVAAPAALRQQVVEVIAKLADAGRLSDLALAAWQANPENRRLKEFVLALTQLPTDEHITIPNKTGDELNGEQELRLRAVEWELKGPDGANGLKSAVREMSQTMRRIETRVNIALAFSVITSVVAIGSVVVLVAGS